jgi:acyl-CoA thioester hydrolase
LRSEERHMPRIKLSEQQTYELRYELQVRPQDINYSGHVGNDNLISLVGAARAHAFHSMGYSELDLGDGKTGVIMTDLVANYRSEAFLFDSLSIDTHLGEPTRTGFRMCHRVRKALAVVALVETGFVTYEYGKKKVVTIPEQFRASVFSPV